MFLERNGTALASHPPVVHPIPLEQAALATREGRPGPEVGIGALSGSHMAHRGDTGGHHVIAGRPIMKEPKHSTAHLRARAKVYMTLKEWDKALEDAEEVYSRAFSQAGSMSLRTEELDEAEALRDEIKVLLDAKGQRLK